MTKQQIIIEGAKRYIRLMEEYDMIASEYLSFPDDSYDAILEERDEAVEKLAANYDEGTWSAIIDAVDHPHEHKLDLEETWK